MRKKKEYYFFLKKKQRGGECEAGRKNEHVEISGGKEKIASAYGCYQVKK